MNKIVFCLLFLFLLAGCREGTYVDKASPSFVDSGSPPMVDNGVPPLPKNDSVINETDEQFVAPPVNYTQNATISIAEKQSFVGRNVVKLWVWNDKGSQSLLMAEGSIVTIDWLGVTVKLFIVGTNGEALFEVNGKRSKALHERQEDQVDGTWLFISDVFLNEASP